MLNLLTIAGVRDGNCVFLNIFQYKIYQYNFVIIDEYYPSHKNGQKIKILIRCIIKIGILIKIFLLKFSKTLDTNDITYIIDI